MIASPWFVQQESGAGVPTNSSVNFAGLFLASPVSIPTGTRTQTPWSAFTPSPLGRTVTDGVIHNTLPTVTSIEAEFSQNDVGSAIMGIGLSDSGSAPCTIIGIVSKNTVVISNPASATATGVTLIIDPFFSLGPTIAGGSGAYLNILRPGRYAIQFSPAYDPSVTSGTYRAFDYFAANFPEDPNTRFFDYVEMSPQAVVDVDNPTFTRYLSCFSGDPNSFFIETFHTHDAGVDVSLRLADCTLNIGLG